MLYFVMRFWPVPSKLAQLGQMDTLSVQVKREGTSCMHARC
jgi:hypothetical protein